MYDSYVARSCRLYDSDVARSCRMNDSYVARSCCMYNSDVARSLFTLRETCFSPKIILSLCAQFKDLNSD